MYSLANERKGVAIQGLSNFGPSLAGIGVPKVNKNERIPGERGNR